MGVPSIRPDADGWGPSARGDVMTRGRIRLRKPPGSRVSPQAGTDPQTRFGYHGIALFLASFRRLFNVTLVAGF